MCSCFCSLFVIAGFYKTYFGLIPDFNPRITTIIHLHAFLMILYVVLLITQPFLVRYKKLRAHRSFGRLSYILVPLIVCSFAGVIYKEISDRQEQHPILYENIKRSMTSISGMILFSTFYMMAIINRHYPKKHMRYIIATGLALVGPALIRLLIFRFHIFPLAAEVTNSIFIDLLIVALIISDRIKNRNYKPYVIILLLFFSSNLVFVFSRFT